MYCIKCGKELPNNVAYCPNCGKEKASVVKPTEKKDLEQEVIYEEIKEIVPTPKVPNIVVYEVIAITMIIAIMSIVLLSRY